VSAPSEAIPTCLMPDPPLNEADREGAGLRSTILIGFAIIAFCIGGFSIWAVLAPLRGAAVATGSVVVDSKRKSIQHLEGGIVSEILVHDGDRVKADQVLMRLDPTQAQATLQQVTSRYNAAAALVARLTAEDTGQSDITYPPALLAQASDPEVAKLIDGQTAIFRARLDELSSQTQILDQRSAQSAEEIRGLEAQIKSQQDQLRLIGEEITNKSALLEKGLVTKPQVLQLQRQQAEIEGAKNVNVASIARAKQSVQENQMRISELRTNRINESSKDHGEALKDLFDFAERVRSAQDVLARTEIRSPSDGTVMAMTVHTVGGVVAPGSTVMEIVPSADQLTIEAKVAVKDIESVHAGLPAQVRLTAYDQRSTPTVDARVSWVSADRVDDDKTGLSYYTTRVEIDHAQLAALDFVHLYPGMPVEVMILGTERTVADYLLAPITRTFARAMRER